MRFPWFSLKLFGKDRNESFLPISHRFMGKLESLHQKELCQIANTQLVTQPAQQDLKYNIGWDFDVVEWCTCAFVKGAATVLAAEDCVFSS